LNFRKPVFDKAVQQWRRQKNFTAGAQPGHYNV